MSTILLAIKPEFVRKIINGEKKYEYRRKLPKREVTKIIIYATNPVMKIVGEVAIEGVLEDAPQNLWEITKEQSGITRDFFEKYFTGAKSAMAYKLGEVIEYEKPRRLEEYGVKAAPQSFCYLSE